MLKRLKALFADTESQQPHKHKHGDKELAAAVLMVEAAKLDGHFGPEERDTITQIVVSKLHLPAGLAADLMAEAERLQNESNQLLRFTRAVKDTYPYEERFEIMEMLWEVVFSDGVLHDYEANLLRRIAGLIYVSDRDSGNARKQALQRLGLDERISTD